MSSFVLKDFSSFTDFFGKLSINKGSKIIYIIHKMLSYDVLQKFHFRMMPEIITENDGRHDCYEWIPSNWDKYLVYINLDKRRIVVQEVIKCPGAIDFFLRYVVGYYNIPPPEKIYI